VVEDVAPDDQVEGRIRLTGLCASATRNWVLSVSPS
jgi:hypothetical protein